MSDLDQEKTALYCMLLNPARCEFCVHQIFLMSATTRVYIVIFFRFFGGNPPSPNLISRKRTD